MDKVHLSQATEPEDSLVLTTKCPGILVLVLVLV